jgi:hypothetical protein
MDFTIGYLSFFVIQPEGAEQDNSKTYRHYQTLGREEYENSAIKQFLDGEFTRIVKRKAEVNPATENPPTKIGRFMVEPGQELAVNPNYNLFGRLRSAADRSQFKAASDDLIRAYLNTSAVRGGAFIVASAKLDRYFDEPFLFVLKCDFEPKIARVSDEESLISQVEMAISARNIKSIQYPHMPEEGMLEESELKIHQASHARYFEDFLKYVSYEKSRPELVEEQLLGMVQQYMDTKWQGYAEDGEQDAESAPFNGTNATDEEGWTLTPSTGVDADRSGLAAAVGTDEDEEFAGRTLAAGPRPDTWEDEGAAPLYAEHEGGLAALGNPMVRDAHGAGEDYEATASALPRQRRIPDARAQEEARLEIWAAGEKRELQERWNHEQVVEAAAQITELQPDWEMKFKLDGVAVRAKMEEYGKNVHIAKLNGRYVVLIEGDSFQFEKARSPIELLYPEELDEVVARLKLKEAERREGER